LRTSIKSFIVNPVIDKFKSVMRYQGKLVAFLLILAFIFWLQTIASTQITQFPPDPFYYAKRLPASYWAGISLLIIILPLMLYRRINVNKTLIEVSFVLVLTMYLFGTTCFIYDNPRFLDVYGVVERINIINTQSQLTGDSGYLNQYPLVTVFLSALSQIAGMKPYIMAQYYPIFTSFALLLLIYALARKVIPEYALIAPSAYASLAWSQSYHMGAQNYALVITVPIIILLLLLNKSSSSGGRVGIASLVIVLWGVTIISHATTPLINLFTLLSLFVVYILLTHLPKIKQIYPLGSVSVNIQAIIRFITLFAVAYFAYAFFNSDFVVNRMVLWGKEIINNLLYDDPFIFVGRNVIKPASSYTLGNNIRMISIIIALVLGIISSLYLLLNRRYINWSIIFVSFFVGYMGFSFVLVFGSFATYGAGRGFIFGIIPLSILWAMVVCDGCRFSNRPPGYDDSHNLKHRALFNRFCPLILTGLIISFVMVSILIIPVTKYASDPYCFVSDSEMAGKVFIEKEPALSLAIRYYYYGSDYMYNNYVYNLQELKQQCGDQYREGFAQNTLNRIYGSGDQCQIYLPVQ